MSKTGKAIGKQVIDLLGHTAQGLGVAAPLLVLPYDGWKTALACVLIAMLAGVVREIDQMRRADTKNYWYWDRTTDVLGHAPGGVIVWAISLAIY